MLVKKIKLLLFDQQNVICKYNENYGFKIAEEVNIHVIFILSIT